MRMFKRSVVWGLVAGLLSMSAVAEEPGGSSREDLQRRLEELERRLETLEGRAVLQAPAEEIRRVRQFVCENGHIHPQRGGGACPDCGRPLQTRTTFRKKIGRVRVSVSLKSARS